MDDALSTATEADREAMAAKVMAWYAEVARQLKPFVDWLARAVSELVRRLRPIMAQIRRYEAARRARISRMHCAYSARRR